MNFYRLFYQALISDRPNGLPDFAKVVESVGVTIKDLSQERAWVAADSHSVEVSAILFIM